MMLALKLSFQILMLLPCASLEEVLPEPDIGRFHGACAPWRVGFEMFRMIDAGNDDKTIDSRCGRTCSQDGREETCLS